MRNYWLRKQARSGEVLLPDSPYPHGSGRQMDEDLEALGSGGLRRELRKPDSAIPRVYTREDVGIAL
jgi:hypothetical protein